MCKMTLGVHPYHAGEIYEHEGSEGSQNSYLASIQKFAEMLLANKSSPLAAFGKIGLDYIYLDRADKDTQQRAFRDQLGLATQLQLPLFLHVRESTDDFISIIKPYLPRLLRGWPDLDISVHGVSFRTEEQIEMVKSIPLEKLQIETDASWCEVLSNDPKIERFLETARPLLPSRKHNKFIAGQMVKTRNESCTVERVELVVAGIKGLTLEEVVEAAWTNSCRMSW
ncbi:uncharacterized protein N7477_004590 [Penicillium maclennaniae]|uniref:uncharacterized protein n=1 Tax=Penicillium maclennaniae TaxID=1343394 RepID=UPI002541D6C6|nr:uncharacterized protein N7477_004590 [Penicillium maclennaniae]KAJ5674656.1 hypothetical protein N7477_004590 [Penicillium maclennaniae]